MDIQMRYVVVRHRFDGRIVLFGTADDETWCFEGDPYWFFRGNFVDTYDIIREYGDDVDNSGEMYDKFIIEFPPKPVDPLTLKMPLGWLSPEGLFYDCEDGGHDNLSCILHTAIFGNHEMNPYSAMHRKGWVCIHSSYVDADVEPYITSAQVNVLTALRESNAGEVRYVRGIRNFMERSDVRRIPAAVQFR